MFSEVYQNNFDYLSKRMKQALQNYKIGILRETRRYNDRRVAITPQTAQIICRQWPHVTIVAQPSEVRVFTDAEYKSAGVEVVEDVSDCDILIGVKEVSDDLLIEGKTYIMFAHVAKKQDHNRGFFKTMVDKNITLLDYEYFTNKNGNRLVAFGHWAGIVGAYYAIMGIQKIYKGKDIPHPSKFYNVDDMNTFLKTLILPPVKIVITGDGRVGKGAAQVLRDQGIPQVSSKEFLNESFETAVFCLLSFHEYVMPIDGNFEKYKEFFVAPNDFKSTFLPYTRVADVYIPCHFWDTNSPMFYTAKEVQNEDFKIRLVADVSCDAPGPVATTIRTSEHNAPFYDVDRFSLQEKPPFSDEKNITVVAVDNLPTALPVNASNTFAEALLENVFPAFFNEDEDGILKRATILKEGKITNNYSYLRSFLDS